MKNISWLFIHNIQVISKYVVYTMCKIWTANIIYIVECNVWINFFNLCFFFFYIFKKQFLGLLKIVLDVRSPLVCLDYPEFHGNI